MSTHLNYRLARGHDLSIHESARMNEQHRPEADAWTNRNPLRGLVGMA